ncbi:hypothetical protein BD560DRAFT_471096 [Blakeslea trispora]|nr:hypothetical protein BD560DRAFT_471096 [Blakeslea trispora]
MTHLSIEQLGDNTKELEYEHVHQYTLRIRFKGILYLKPNLLVPSFAVKRMQSITLLLKAVCYTSIRKETVAMLAHSQIGGLDKQRLKSNSSKVFVFKNIYVSLNDDSNQFHWPTKTNPHEILGWLFKREVSVHPVHLIPAIETEQKESTNAL